MKPDIHARNGAVTARLRGREAVCAIRISGRVRASPDRVFRAWLDPSIAGRWLFATAGRPLGTVVIDARIDGAFALVDRRRSGVVEHSGRYLDIEAPRRLALSLRSDDLDQADTRVCVELAPLAAGCRVLVTHENVPLRRAAYARSRWMGMLYGLDEVLA